MDPNIIDELSRQISRALPDSVNAIRQDLETNIRATLSSLLGKMNLVSREEFEIQQRVLERTRAKLEQLEKQVSELEKSS